MVEKILLEKNVLLNCRIQSKEEVITCLANLLQKNDCISDSKKLKEEIWEREYLGYTGIGNHIALAHAESETVSGVVTACIRLEEFVDWAPGETYPEPYKLVKLIFVFVIPMEKCKEVEILKSMVLKLGKREQIQKLMNAKDRQEIIQVFK